MAGLFPIGSLNFLLRTSNWDIAVWKALGVLSALTGIFFAASVWIYSRYSE